MTEHGPLARNTDPGSAHTGAAKATQAMGRHKRTALSVYRTNNGVPMSAQDVRDWLVHSGVTSSLSTAESVRRRVNDLHADGYLVVYRPNGPTGMTFLLNPDRMDEIEAHFRR